MAPTPPPSPVARGFTLVEVLLALAALALMAGMSWQSIDGLLRAQAANQRAADASSQLQATLSQWDADLNAVAESDVVTAIDFDGKRLRLTRRDAAAPGQGLRVVVWSIENRQGVNQLIRWQSPLIDNRARIEAAWQQATQTGAARAGEVTALPAEDWQILYFRRNTWVNPLSASELANAQSIARQVEAATQSLRRLADSGAPSPQAGSSAPQPAAAAVNALSALPDAIRLQLRIPPQADGAQGALVKDWIRPQWVASAG